MVNGPGQPIRNIMKCENSTKLRIWLYELFFKKTNSFQKMTENVARQVLT